MIGRNRDKNLELIGRSLIHLTPLADLSSSWDFHKWALLDLMWRARAVQFDLALSQPTFGSWAHPVRILPNQEVSTNGPPKSHIGLLRPQKQLIRGHERSSYLAAKFTVNKWVSQPTTSHATGSLRPWKHLPCYYACYATGRNNAELSSHWQPVSLLISSWFPFQSKAIHRVVWRWR